MRFCLLALLHFSIDLHPECMLISSIFAGFHTDLNFLTIHGQSRYPGRKYRCLASPRRPTRRRDTGAHTAVHVWARNSGKRIPVRIPPGCLLVQAGKQIEWMTGGLIKGTWTLNCGVSIVRG